jgi:hypothetical protein
MRNRNPDELRALADVCLNWAVDAPTEEARNACLLLARTWLREAMRQDGDTKHLPLASTLEGDILPSLAELNQAVGRSG